MVEAPGEQILNIEIHARHGEKDDQVLVR